MPGKKSLGLADQIQGLVGKRVTIKLKRAKYGQDQFEGSLNAFVVGVGGKVVLIDAGFRMITARVNEIESINAIG